MIPISPVILIVQGVIMRSKIDKEKLDDFAFRMFSGLYPHEAFIASPKQFWELFHKLYPDVSYLQILEVMNDTGTDEPC
mgnify:CR=1 FL=1